MTQNSNQTNDLNLVKSIQNGNVSDFGSLYDCYIKKIYDFIYYKTLNKEVAEDICSEVFMKALKNINQFTEGSFGAWLYAIARNAVIDHYRRNVDVSDIEDCWDLSDGEDFLGLIDSNLKVEAIKKAMFDLRIEERELLIMRLWLDLPFKEMAQQLNKTEGAVKMSFNRALINLKNKVPLAIFILWPELIKIWK